MVNILERTIREKFVSLKPVLDEQSRRLWAASEAKSLGHGGISIVSRATGLSRTTIHQGIKNLSATKSSTPVSMKQKRIRSSGGGRKPITETDPTVLLDLERLMEPLTRGDTESPLRWTCKSVRQLTAAMHKQGHVIERQKVAHLLSELGYNLQSNRKTREGKQHPDRDAQFYFISERVIQFQAAGQPVISVDTKKKELVCDFKNGGREWNPKGNSEHMDVYDFMDKQKGKVNPYGIYDQTANRGWVSVVPDHDTAEFAVESIRRWWRKMGADQYPTAKELLMTADCGGSNGNRVRLWKIALQNFSDGNRSRS